MNAFINSIYAALGGNWIAIVIMVIAVIIVMGIIGFFVDRVSKPSAAKIIIMNVAMSVVWAVMFLAIGKQHLAGVLIGLQGAGMMQQLATLKMYKAWQDMSANANLGGAAA
jgi:hypothetical protein